MYPPFHTSKQGLVFLLELLIDGETYREGRDKSDF